ncbi:Stp1/IreP family PP2C-type Ser/Thr phosphatase [Chengkuizengella axinellae]|uniref:Stp1/IreP family PP2C-type Ser/Thr phosphatase n=1 Tax=Chengkuizengella axinellae TaxID=3064388 RepID=A0ABT9IVI9_9BACL|nr:Stp1/IreP family PP2C-type Ser/Thr phosphatase [Chengkuizengella sp. 2205SS18-9]MDP5273368.1 Stp1/IreP family PP2C-type Ser/Thr phosphatase [Chengkuizengella sp. 2205SS18-9]
MKSTNKTDVGRTRAVNEDRAVVQTELNGYTLAIVADGMGGHQAGDIASQITIETIQESLHTLEAGMSVEECEMTIREAIYLANAKIFQLASENDKYAGMGTTVVVALATDELILIAHIGDSRAYKFSGESMMQLTEDHSLVNELVKSGQISPEEAEQHPRRNLLTRALGTEEYVTIEIHHHEWDQHDVLMLCSDGLSSLVKQENMIQILKKDQDLDLTASELIEHALEAGGDDNITVVLLMNE